MFTEAQKTALDAKLDRSAIKSRTQSGRQLSYIEGWHAIAEANRIFGFDAWNRETQDIRCVAERERKIGQNGKDGWGVSYIARVRITIGAIVREGVGSGHGIDADLGLAHESAIKEAETDAMKRALMTFGNPFGLALYDKTQANVDDGQSASGEAANVVSLSKTQARPEYTRLIEDMRRNATKADLRRWMSDGEVRAIRQTLPADWDAKLKQDAAEFGRNLPDGVPSAVDNMRAG